MNKREIQNLAYEWTLSAKKDLRTKVINFMEETDSTPTDVAEELGVSATDISKILHGDGNIPIESFAKILIASGFAVEMKPLNQTPFAHINEMRNIEDDEIENEYELDMTQNTPHYSVPTYTASWKNPFVSDSTMHENVMRRLQNDAASAAHHHCTHDANCTCGHHHAETSAIRVNGETHNPFASMTIQQLKDIIEKNLWDSEININSNNRQEFIDFLVKKDKMRKAYAKRKTEPQQNPKIAEFMKRIQSTVEKNPHLKTYLKNLVGESFED